MSESDQEFIVSPQHIGGRLRWQPVSGAAIVVEGRFDWIALVRLLILAAAALVAFLALEWQTGVYENAAQNSEAILAGQGRTQSVQIPDFGPLPTVAPPEAAVPRQSPTQAPLAPQPAPASAPLQHVVQPGETLDEIAARYSVSLQELLEANPGIVDPDLIVTGDTIAIVV